MKRNWNKKGKIFLLCLFSLMAVQTDLFAEVQNTVVMSAPSPTPGSSGAFSASQATGPTAAASGTSYDTYAGVRRYVVASGTGRYSTLAGAERYGVLFDTFQMFQNLLTPFHLTVVSSGTTCPSSPTTYTWIKVRFRTPDAVRNPMTASDSGEAVGGVTVYNSGATYDFTGGSYFNLSGPSVTTASYGVDRLSSACSSGTMVNAAASNTIWDSYGNTFFGDENFVFVTEHGSPQVIIGAPQVTLSSGDFSALFGNALSGILTVFNSTTSQTRSNIFLVPDSAGTTFTLREATSVNDPFTYSSYGTLTCTSLNSPSDGFCSGTLTLTGEGGTGKAVCQLSTPGSRNLLACAAQRPSDNTKFVSLVAATSDLAVVASIPDAPAESAIITPPTGPVITITVKNMTGRKVASMGQPAVAGQRPQSPFTYEGGTYPGTTGSCGSSLDGYSTCTVAVTYYPTLLTTVAQTFRQEYDNGSTTVQSTGNIRGIAGVTSITITPSTTSYASGATQQFTATATYSDLSTEDVTNLVDWTATNLTIAPIDSTGSVTFNGVGSSTISASIGDVTSNSVAITTSQAPITVHSSTSSGATGDNANRRVFYDSVNSRHWAFYYTGSAIGWSYSSDGGATWTADSTLAYNTKNFDVTFKVIGGTAYVFLATEADSYDIVMRRGTCGASMITFDSAITYLDGTSANDMYVKPAIGLSASNYVWVAAFKDVGTLRQDRYQAYAIVSSNVGSGTLSSLGTAAAVGRNIYSYKSLSLMNKTTTDMYLVVNEGPAVRAYEYTSSAWKDLRTPSSFESGKYDYWTGPSAGANGTVWGLAYVSTSEIYLAGNFTNLGGNANADYVAKWNGTNWESLGVGLNNYANRVAVSGSNVFVGGIFTDAGGNTNADLVARWNGTTWNSLGVGLGAGEVLAIYSDSANGYLYAAGNFTDGGGNSNCDYVCKYDVGGGTWTSLAAAGLSSRAYAIAGDGTNVYVGGGFQNAGGNASADRIIRLNAGTYYAMGSGASANSILAITIDGSDVYVGGSSVNIGGNASCDNLCKWNGSSWAALGSGPGGQVDDIAVIGSNVYASGGSLWSLSYLGRFNGTTWVNVGTGSSKGLDSVAPQIQAVGSNLYLAANATRAGDDYSVNMLIRWDETAQNFYPFGSQAAIRSRARAVAENSAGKIFVGGDFIYGGGNSSNLYGMEWTATGTGVITGGLDSAIYAIAADASGGNVYFGGDFSNNDGNANADGIVKWNGTALSAVGAVSTSGSVAVRNILVDGSMVYVGGNFANYGGNASSDNIAVYDGSAWSALSTGVNSTVYAIAGTGTSIYVGGDFTDAGTNTSADRIAKWNGTTFSALGTGAASGSVRAIFVDGANIYAGGTFLDMGGNTSADYLAMWNGTNWVSVGAGVSGQVNTFAKDAGGNIYFGGNFTDAGGNASADYLAKWNGSSIVAEGTGMNGEVDKIIVASNDRLFAVGAFTGFGDARPAGCIAYREKVSGLAASNAASEFSVVSDGSGNLLQLSVNASGYAAFDLFDVTTGWQTSTALSAATSASPCIASDSSTGDRYAFWRETNNVKYKQYTSSAWGSAVSLFSTGTNRHLTCDPQYSSAGKSMLLFTEGSGSPYNATSFLSP